MIKLVVFDFDGVFTNGEVIFDNHNNIIKKYNVKDGLGINLLKEKNIKIGCISGYKENKSQQNILEHLKIDYISMGKNKSETLNLWIKELNITLEEVAYMGDDINDLEVMKIVKITGCPSDAVSEIREICDFVSDKKGGEGCIREFCEFILDNSNNNILIKIKKELFYQLDNFNLDDIHKLSDIIRKTDGNIFFMGIGKSGNMANHCSDLLKSISIKAIYLEYTSLLHGDLGILNDNDIVMLFSNSGNTVELINIIKYIKCKQIIGICSNNESKFNELCNQTFIIPFENEISGEINKIPTNSCMTQLLFSNILVSILKNDINIDIYKNNHPKGSIGNNLLKIKDVLITEFPKLILDEKIELSKVLLNMTEYKIGCCFLINKNQKLLGILTDGDVRRLLIKEKDLNIITIDNINTDYYYETDLDKFISKCKSNIYIPILDNNKLLGIVTH